jgi:flagellar biosynthesis protein FlhB
MAQPIAPPTARRLRRARQHGNVPASRMAPGAAAIVGGCVTLPASVVSMRDAFVRALEAGLADPARAADSGHLTGLMVETALALAPTLVTAAAAAITVTLIQTGGTLAPRRRDRSERPRVTEDRLYGLARSVIVALCMGGVAWLALRGAVVSAAEPPLGATESLSVVARALGRVVWSMAAMLVVLAAADAIVTRVAWKAQLWMTREELDDERRESEVAPELAGARAAAHREL